MNLLSAIFDDSLLVGEYISSKTSSTLPKILSPVGRVVLELPLNESRRLSIMLRACDVTVPNLPAKFASGVGSSFACPCIIESIKNSVPVTNDSSSSLVSGDSNGSTNVLSAPRTFINPVMAFFPACGASSTSPPGRPNILSNTFPSFGAANVFCNAALVLDLPRPADTTSSLATKLARNLILLSADVKTCSDAMLLKNESIISE